MSITPRLLAALLAMGVIVPCFGQTISLVEDGVYYCTRNFCMEISSDGTRDVPPTKYSPIDRFARFASEVDSRLVIPEGRTFCNGVRGNVHNTWIYSERSEIGTDFSVWEFDEQSGAARLLLNQSTSPVAGMFLMPFAATEATIFLEARKLDHANDHGGIWLYNRKTTKIRQLDVANNYNSTPKLSPQGSALLYVVTSDKSLHPSASATYELVAHGITTGVVTRLAVEPNRIVEYGWSNEQYHTIHPSPERNMVAGFKLPWEGGITRCVTRDGDPLPTGPIGSTSPCSYLGDHGYIAWDFDTDNFSDEPILSVAAGEVVFTAFAPGPDGYDPSGYGNWVIVKHDNDYRTLYAHLSSVLVSQGDYVAQGCVLGYEGNTGASNGDHLHFEYEYPGGLSGNLYTSFDECGCEPHGGWSYTSANFDGNCCEDTEPNDTWSDAQLLSNNEAYDFCLQQQDTEDWFLFTVSQEGELTIVIDNISNPLIYFELYDSGMDVVASDLTGTTGPKTFSYCWPGALSCAPLYLRVWPDVVFSNVVRTYSLTSSWDPGVSCFTSLMPPSYSVIVDPTPTCAGQNVSLEAIPDGAVSYTWHSAANGGGSVVGSTSAITVAPTSSATYSVVIAPSCNPVDNVTINVPLTVLAVPTANAGSNQTIASGGSTPLAGSGGSTYSWAPTISLSNPNIWNPVASPTVTTTYTLTVTNANGCTDTDQVTITVTGTGGGGAPANDNPCSATPLTVSSSCSYITGTNVGATGSSVPTPSTCAASSTSSNPSGNYQGGDVWYSAVVPSSGQLIIQTQIQSSVTDLVIVAYTGASCSSLTQFACNDDQVLGANYMPRLSLTGLTVGQTIWFRIYDFGNNTYGNFGVCVYNPGGGSSSGRDLISWITSVSDNTVDQGDNVSVTYKVKNIGTLNVTTPFLSALYLSTDPNYNSGSDELVDGSIDAFISLNAGQEYTVTNTVTIPNEPDGNYYLVSYADAASAVGEISETNNFGYWAIQLGNLVADGPNLEVDDVDVIPNVGLAPGQEVDVEVRLQNTGTEVSDNCRVLVVFDLNDNHQYDPGVDPVLENIFFPDLQPGEDDTRTRDVLLPTNIPATGGYDIIAVADINNECNETNESDQEGSEEVDIVTLTPAGPDLVPALDWIELPPPSNVQVSSQDLCVTSGYDIFFRVTNIGNLQSQSGLGNVDTRVYISSDPIISGNDYVWTLKWHSSGSWNVGQVRSYRDDDSFEGMSPGPAYIIISTDEDNVLPETNEANNIIAIPIYLTTCGIGLPDLTGTIDFYTPFSSALGDTITAEVTVWNQGTAPAPPTSLGLYISDDQQYDGNGGLGLEDYRLENFGYINISDSLFPGDTIHLAIAGSSQGLASTGLKYLIMAIDDNTDINELNRSNNNITAPIEITSIACYYNPEWLQLDTPYVNYLGWTGFPLYMNTEEGCAWTLSENVSWASGNNGLDADDGPWYMGITENPYPIARIVPVHLNGSPLLSITQGPRPCALVGDSLSPHITAIITQASCNQPNGAIHVSGTGHYLPLQYIWSTSETSANLESLMPGNYSLTITDAAGCTLDTAFTITNAGTACTPVQLHVNLEGPFNGTNMNDALRTAGFIPTTEPYTAMGWHVGSGGGEVVGFDRLAVSGDSAIIDWILIELRSSNDPTQVLETRSALLLRNGAIVNPSGSAPLVYDYASGTFHLAVRHRNHLGVMTGTAVAFTGSLVTIDFRNPATGTWGTEAQKTIGSIRTMWAGNTSGDDVLKYTGPNNDRDPVLVRIGGVIPTNTVAGYFVEDCNLNGVVKYTGSSNDRDPILVNIGGVVPTNTRQEQLP